MASSKKCPKCGEDNPAEAVMCWACYTPLSGSAPLGAGLAAGVATAGAMPRTTGAPVGIPQTDEPAKKGIDPKVMAVGGFLLLALVGGGIAMSGMLGGGAAEEPTVTTGIDPNQTGPINTGGGGNTPPSMSIAPVLGGGGGGAAAPAAVPLPFTTIATPGAKYATGTLGILITGQTNLAGAAKFAKDQFARNGKWKNMQVAVFTDKNAADTFGKFQRDNQNAPISGGVYQQLAAQGVWANTPVFLDSRGGKDTIYRPSERPQSWWPNR